MATYTHEMTLYNLDLQVYWDFKEDAIKVKEVHVRYHDSPDMIRFLSKDVLDSIIRHIEFYELGRE
jgi:hypothetical protein